MTTAALAWSVPAWPLAAVLLTALVTAPLARRTARYPKVSTGPLAAWREGTGA